MHAAKAVPPLLLLLLIARGTIARPAWCDASAPRPRVYIYDLPIEFRRPPNDWRGVPLLIRRLRSSPFFEPEGQCADFYLLPHHSGKGNAKVIRMFEYVAAKWPFWNDTFSERRARHIMQLPCDHGPGDCNFDRPLRAGRQPLSALSLNPADRERRVLFFEYNGERDYRTNFLAGTDVRLPTPHRHQCGPLCGFHLADLRALSPWAKPAGPLRDAELQRRRPVTFFWAGSSRRRRDARDLLLKHFEAKPGWRVIRLTDAPRAPKKVALPGGAAANTLVGASRALPKATAAPLAAWAAKPVSPIARSKARSVGSAASVAVASDATFGTAGHGPRRLAQARLRRLHRRRALAATTGEGVHPQQEGREREQRPGWWSAAAAAEPSHELSLCAAALSMLRAALQAVERSASFLRATPQPTTRSHGGRRLLAPRGKRGGGAGGKPVLAREMAAADFCGSPLGWDAGDSDRYLPAILLGCIPVFFSGTEARPLEELLPWDNVSLRVPLDEIPRLASTLAEISPERVVRMREAMAGVWERLLYSSYPPSAESLGGDLPEFGFGEPRPNITSYLGESGSRDAFDGVMAVLRMRALAWEREDAAAASVGQPPNPALLLPRASLATTTTSPNQQP